MGLAINQSTGVAERGGMTEERDIELLRSLIERKENRVVHLPLLGVAHKMSGFTAQFFDAAP